MPGSIIVESPRVGGGSQLEQKKNIGQAPLFRVGAGHVGNALLSPPRDAMETGMRQVTEVELLWRLRYEVSRIRAATRNDR